MRHLLVLLGCVSITAACAAGPGPEADPANPASQQQAATSAPTSMGRIYADKACANCHAVAADQARSPDPRAPTFVAIANTPGMTTMALNVWLRSTVHPNMPYVRVDPDQLEMLSEYLYSLKK